MSIEQRITRLEKANRNLRLCIILTVLVTAGALGWRGNHLSFAEAQEKKDATVIRAQRFEIVDNGGKVAGFFGEIGPGEVMLRMGPSDRFAALSSLTGGTSLSLGDGESTAKLKPYSISLSRRSVSQIKEQDRINRKLATGAEVSPDEIARSVPQEAVSMHVSDDRRGYLIVGNSFGKDVVSIEANKANAGAVYVYDVNGKIKKALTGE